MSVFYKGSKVSEIYVKGSRVASGYSKGSLVYSRKQGWELGTDLVITINSSNNNSVTGTITLNQYNYYEGGTITDSYYQVAARSLSRTTEGVATLSLGSGANIVFGDATNNALYPVTSSGTITLSASELNSIYRIRKSSGSYSLGSTMTVTSYYLEPVQDMGISQLSSDLYLASGWAIANNRTSRIKTSSSITTSLSNLSTPGDGTWPVYAVAVSGTEVSTSFVTCSRTAHYEYDSKNIRHLGWVTVANGYITGVNSINSSTGSSLSKSISDTTLTVSAGYATDTDGCTVYVPGFTYSFSDMVTAAADTTTNETLGSKTTLIDTTASSSASHSAGTVLFWSTGSSYYDKIKTTTQRAKITAFKGSGASSPRVTAIEVNYSKLEGATYSSSADYPWSTVWTGSIAGNANTSSRPTFYIPKNSSVYNMRVTWEGSSGKGALRNYVMYQYVTQEASTTPGTAQTRTIYAKVTRTQTSSSKSVTSQTSTGDSTPYVSYVEIGTITVARNASTGSIS